MENTWEKNVQNQTNTKHSSNPNIFKSATISKVLSKIPNRKKTSKQQYNFCKTKISLKVHGM